MFDPQPPAMRASSRLHAQDAANLHHVVRNDRQVERAVRHAQDAIAPAANLHADLPVRMLLLEACQGVNFSLLTENSRQKERTSQPSIAVFSSEMRASHLDALLPSR